jgi:hypothetical protein
MNGRNYSDAEVIVEVERLRRTIWTVIYSSEMPAGL